MPTNYQLIYEAIDDKKGISAKYQRDPPGSGERMFLPYILGRSEKPNSTVEEPIVLCYQYDGYTPGQLETPHPHRKNWRCFKLDLLTEVEPVNASFPWEPTMTGKHRQRQNCVEIRTKWRLP